MLDDVASRDQYLNTALDQASNEKSLCLATKTEFLLKDGQHQEALRILQSLYSEVDCNQPAFFSWNWKLNSKQEIGMQSLI